MYALVENGVFVKWVDLQKDYPQVSFPSGTPDHTLPEGVVRVKNGFVPAPARFEQLVRNTTPTYQNGDWVLEYSVKPVDDAERAALTAQEANSVRSLRAAELAATDWTQLADANVDAAIWARYRQALRDLPTQEGFPFDIQWPVKPE